MFSVIWLWLWFELYHEGHITEICLNCNNFGIYLWIISFLYKRTLMTKLTWCTDGDDDDVDDDVFMIMYGWWW
jgi:hypothetical protein